MSAEAVVWSKIGLSTRAARSGPECTAIIARRHGARKKQTAPAPVPKIARCHGV
jgi:hypothetical protein